MPKKKQVRKKQKGGSVKKVAKKIAIGTAAIAPLALPFVAQAIINSALGTTPNPNSRVTYNQVSYSDIFKDIFSKD